MWFGVVSQARAGACRGIELPAPATAPAQLPSALPEGAPAALSATAAPHLPEPVLRVIAISDSPEASQPAQDGLAAERSTQDGAHSPMAPGLRGDVAPQRRGRAVRSAAQRQNRRSDSTQAGDAATQEQSHAAVAEPTWMADEAASDAPSMSWPRSGATPPVAVQDAAAGALTTAARILAGPYQIDIAALQRGILRTSSGTLLEDFVRGHAPAAGALSLLSLGPATMAEIGVTCFRSCAGLVIAIEQCPLMQEIGRGMM